MVIIGDNTPSPAAAQDATASAGAWLNDIGRLDVRMVMALHAILTQQNVGRVARDFGMSQPGMSNALARMRTTFGDPLLVRTRSSMRLTPRGEQLRDHLTGLNTLLEGLIRSTSFDPRSSEELFRIIATDDASLLIAPALIGNIRALGRNVNVSLHSGQAPADAWRETRNPHLFLGYTRSELPGLSTLEFFRDDLVIICRKGLLPNSRPLRASEIGHLAHVAPSDDRSEFSRIVEGWLNREGMAMNVGVRTSGLSATPAIVSQSDLIAVLPATLAADFAADFPLEVLHLAPPVPRLIFRAEWPSALDGNAGQRWLLDMLRAAAALHSGPSRPEPAVLAILSNMSGTGQL